MDAWVCHRCDSGARSLYGRVYTSVLYTPLRACLSAQQVEGQHRHVAMALHRQQQQQHGVRRHDRPRGRCLRCALHGCNSTETLELDQGRWLSLGVHCPTRIPPDYSRFFFHISNLQDKQRCALRSHLWDHTPAANCPTCRSRPVRGCWLQSQTPNHRHPIAHLYMYDTKHAGRGPFEGRVQRYVCPQVKNFKWHPYLYWCTPVTVGAFAWARVICSELGAGSYTSKRISAAMSGIT